MLENKSTAKRNGRLAVRAGPKRPIPQPQTKCDKLGAKKSCSVEYSLPKAARFFPTLSELLHAMDTCPGCFSQWGGSGPGRQAYYRGKISQWKAAGRPRLDWPQAPAAIHPA